MAKKQILGVGLLASGRAIRVARLDVKLLQEVTRRVARKFPTPQEGEPEPTKADISIEMENAEIDMCVRGYTPSPVDFVFKEVPTDSPLLPAKQRRAPAEPGETVKIVDVQATLAPYVDPEAPQFKRWVPLTEMQLSNDEDDCSKYNLFADPIEWKSVVDHINDNSGGGMSSNPFAGKLVKTSAG